jgi:putative solute:sodium symporter small subunit
MTEPIPEKLGRVTVSHPMTSSVRGPHRGSLSVDARQESAVGEVALRSMMRAQLRLAARWFIALMVLLGTMVTVLSVVPAVHSYRLVGIPLAWWLLGVGCFPVFGWIAVRYVRSVEALEQRFNALVASTSRETI